MSAQLQSISAQPVTSYGFSQSQSGQGSEKSSAGELFRLPGLAQYGGNAKSKQGDAGQETRQGFDDSLNLSPEARKQLNELKQRDAEVRAHESAHMAAGGQYVTGGPSYTYQQGPDGRQYAIGGHVSIDTSSVPGDPEKTEEKARQIRRAALAPGEPSGQDRQVAADAAALEAKATREKASDDDSQTTDGVAKGMGNPKSGAPDQPVAAAGRESQASNTRAMAHAAQVYAEMGMRGNMPTSLAPYGTGISLQV